MTKPARFGRRSIKPHDDTGTLRLMSGYMIIIDHAAPLSEDFLDHLIEHLVPGQAEMAEMIGPDMAMMTSEDTTAVEILSAAVEIIDHERSSRDDAAEFSRDGYLQFCAARALIDAGVRGVISSYPVKYAV